MESASSSFPSAPHVRSSAACSSSGVVQDASAAAIALSAFVGRMVRGAIARLVRSGSVRCLGVDALSHRDGVQLGVGRLLLVEIGGEEAHDVVVAEGFGPGDQGAVAAHLVM